MKCILMSIKPNFVAEIRNGNKLFEFRKAIPQNHQVNKIIIYSSFPKKKVVGECIIEYILQDHPSKIWEKTYQHAGISKTSFDKYFKEKNIAYAIKMKDILFYECEKDLSDYGIEKAPQSYRYIDL